MFKRFALFAVLFLVLAVNLSAQIFPKSAVILEKAKVTANREMVLWMESPKKNPRDPADETYTCPENTRGHYYTGVTKVSLVNIKTKKLLNTLEITSDGIESGLNTLDLPYLIRKGYYDVPRIDKNKEGKPVLMKLKDYNGDGKAFEFALFDAFACMGLQTTLIGYSAKQDKVIQYETELKTSGKTSKDFWVDYLFGRKPDKQGVWKYEVDYRGRDGALEKYEIRYDRQKEMFYGTRMRIFEEEKPGK